MLRLLLSIVILLSTTSLVYAESCCKCKDGYVPSQIVPSDNSKIVSTVCSSLCKDNGGYLGTYILRESPSLSQPVSCGMPCSNSKSSCYRPGQRICDDTARDQENECVESTDFKCVTLKSLPWPRCKTKCTCDNWTGGGWFGGKGHTTNDEDCSCKRSCEEKEKDIETSEELKVVECRSDSSMEQAMKQVELIKAEFLRKYPITDCGTCKDLYVCKAINVRFIEPILLPYKGDPCGIDKNGERLFMYGFTVKPGKVKYICDCVLLVTLDYFGTVVYTDKNNCHVILEWETATEIDTVGFNIWRAQVEDGKYVNITKVNDQLVGIKAENDYQGASYEYEDYNVIPGNTYYYVLEDVDFFGLSTVHYDFIDSATVQFPLVGNP